MDRRDEAGRFEDALWAAGIVAIDPAAIGGVVVRARAGPIRDQWLEYLQSLLPMDTPSRRLPIHVDDERLLGGLDLTATLETGRPVAQRGLLAEADGGVLVLPMAERIEGALAARLASVLDSRQVRLARDGLEACIPASIGLVALDEGIEPDEGLPAVLLERLGLQLDLSDLRIDDLDVPIPFDPSSIDAARQRAAGVQVGEAEVEALCAACMALGIQSMRAPMQAVAAARAIAALRGDHVTRPEDVAIAARLVLARRALTAPSSDAQDPSEDESEPEPPNDMDAEDGEETVSSSEASGDESEVPAPEDVEALAEVVLEAARAALPVGLMEGLTQGRAQGGGQPTAGRVGEQRFSLRRGRPAGVCARPLVAGARVHVLETLRAAAPWQPMRRRERAALSGDRARGLEIRRSDLRVRRHRERSETTVIFAVDASGSTALHRLAEAKGAVELLLADCYVRRDRVALIAFRGQGADLLLPPTRSLVRAKRSLSGLPGGGGTPLASALDLAFELAGAVGRRGGTPLVVLLTDGQANVARDGTPGRAAAAEDAKAAACRLREVGWASLLIDTSMRSKPEALALAEALGARYQLLPHAKAAALRDVVRDAARPSSVATSAVGR